MQQIHFQEILVEVSIHTVLVSVLQTNWWPHNGKSSMSNFIQHLRHQTGKKNQVKPLNLKFFRRFVNDVISGRVKNTHDLKI